jgi:uncharacterized protein (DUF927 family)
MEHGEEAVHHRTRGFSTGDQPLKTPNRANPVKVEDFGDEDLPPY